ncbi:MAG: hypothetical protein R6W69_03295 [Anaerolineales bacterium]
MKSKLSGYSLVPRLEQRQEGLWLWRRLLCAKCGGKVGQLTLEIPRHAARELIENGILGGEAEHLFHSTRDDLGWRVRGWGCAICRQFAPVELIHKRG